MNSTQILGIKINGPRHRDFSKILDNFIAKKSKGIICTVNTEFIIKAQKDKDFANILNNFSSLNLPDGFGILWAAKFLNLKQVQIPIVREIIILLQWVLTLAAIPFFPGFFKKPLPERIAGSDITKDMAIYASEHKLRLFLLGGDPTIAERASLKLQTDIFGLRIAGVHSGGPKDTKEIIQAINKSKAEIILVAFGAPKQEKWLAENLKKTCCKIGIGVGGTFDFIAEVKNRAPFWMRRSGLEWFYRLIQEPKRITRQIALPKFMVLILIDKLKHTS